jgi:hypothetical protein
MARLQRQTQTLTSLIRPSLDAGYVAETSSLVAKVPPIILSDTRRKNKCRPATVSQSITVILNCSWGDQVEQNVFNW